MNRSNTKALSFIDSQLKAFFLLLFFSSFFLSLSLLSFFLFDAYFSHTDYTLSPLTSPSLSLPPSTQPVVPAVLQQPPNRTALPAGGSAVKYSVDFVVTFLTIAIIFIMLRSSLLDFKMFCPVCHSYCSLTRL